ncbi:type II toxin-antitoxin system VapC family toxin [Saccharolobus caldissimus]|uniref:Nucleic acid-binding protein n=1 Tax=Saccharolobus caldissimus TaxID=1702097 RepID=A0AAQ4CR19_9CREN|nr:type II toxin-antitoxin system VapC family toxin [Saccharolobus caldissimus]BDB98250.1 nucleic acid-binding protein [Saccharolobus caldissimus]
MNLNVKFIDSNVFIYAILKPKRSVDEKIVKMKEKAKEILARIDNGEEKVLTTVVHISEIANVIESLSNLTTSIKVIENIINNENIVIKEVTVQDYTEAVKIANEENVSINDAIAYVIMMKNGINEIYTFDEKHFKKLNVKIL